MRNNPLLYEINAYRYIRRLSQKYQRRLTLSTIPDEEWHLLAQKGFDLVWLMGVWQRSPGARQRALSEPALCQEFSQVLPDWTEADVVGSPYAIYSYTLEPTLGGTEELSQLKQKLNRMGLGLILDFVPNHLAFDHPWVLSYPGRFVRGTVEDKQLHPDWFFSPAPDIYMANGRDPYFPPWSDTVQLNIYSTALRRALINELLKIAEVADGVRCDMAMLVLNDIFEQVWGGLVIGCPRPQNEFWAEAIGRVRQKQPEFLFLGEVYWSLEKQLHKLGFNYTYDKNLYDRLRYAEAPEILQQLTVSGLYQSRMARFIENHDEPRAVTAFGSKKSLAAAAVINTVPGLRFIHDGQIEGNTVRSPVQLAREPEEPANNEIQTFYEQLLSATNDPAFHDGKWQTTKVEIPNGNSPTPMLAWYWQYDQKLILVAINYSDEITQCRIKLPASITEGENPINHDILTGQEIKYSIADHWMQMDFSPYKVLITDLIINNLT